MLTFSHSANSNTLGIITDTAGEKMKQTKKSLRPDDLTGEFYKTIRELKPILLKLIQKVEKERTHPN